MTQKILITPTEETVDLLPGYLERRKLELALMTEAAGKGDFQALLTFGHNVKGTAGSYGLPELGNLAEAVHGTAARQDAEGCQRALSAYGAYLERLELVESA